MWWRIPDGGGRGMEEDAMKRKEWKTVIWHIYEASMIKYISLYAKLKINKIKLFLKVKTSSPMYCKICNSKKMGTFANDLEKAIFMWKVYFYCLTFLPLYYKCFLWKYFNNLMRVLCWQRVDTDFTWYSSSHIYSLYFHKVMHKLLTIKNKTSHNR